MNIKINLTISFIVSLLFFKVKAQNTLEDDCIKLEDCPIGLKHVKRRNNPFSLSVLRSAHCGYRNGEATVKCKNIPDIPSDVQNNPKVKCDCIYIEDCPEAFEVVKTRTRDPEILNVLRKAHCSMLGRRTKTRCTIVTHFLQERRKSENLKKMALLPSIDEEECGVQLAEEKIIGGTLTGIDEFPWTALIKYRKGNKTKYACHGTVINKKYILTAAHCMDDNAITNAGELHSVVLGEYDLQNVRDCEYGPFNSSYCSDPIQEIPIESFILHKNYYNGLWIGSDIGLIRVKKEIQFTDFVKPICLPLSDIKLKENQSMWITGWGQTETSKMSRYKLKASIPYVSSLKCDSQPNSDFDQVNICAGIGNGIDSCKGDSGGPLMVNHVYKNLGYFHFIVGVVSRGPECGRGSAIYTRVSTHLDWILYNMHN